MSGRYTGILDSKQKSLMLFCAPWFTMPWSDKLTKAESRAYDFWTHTSALTDYYQQKETQRTAALIVNNAREFAYHYNTFDRANKKNRCFWRRIRSYVYHSKLGGRSQVITMADV